MGEGEPDDVAVRNDRDDPATVARRECVHRVDASPLDLRKGLASREAHGRRRVLDLPPQLRLGELGEWSSRPATELDLADVRNEADGNPSGRRDGLRGLAAALQGARVNTGEGNGREAFREALGLRSSSLRKQNPRGGSRQALARRFGEGMADQQQHGHAGRIEAPNALALPKGSPGVIHDIVVARGEGKTDGEGGPSSEFAFDADGASMVLGYVLHDRKAEAGSPG